MNERSDDLLAGLMRESVTTKAAARTCADVLASLETAFRQLQELADRGELIEGGCAEDALDRLDQAIGMLTPSETEEPCDSTA